MQPLTIVETAQLVSRCIAGKAAVISMQKQTTTNENVPVLTVPPASLQHRYTPVLLVGSSTEQSREARPWPLYAVLLSAPGNAQRSCIAAA